MDKHNKFTKSLLGELIAERLVHELHGHKCHQRWFPSLLPCVSYSHNSCLCQLTFSNEGTGSTKRDFTSHAKQLHKMGISFSPKRLQPSIIKVFNKMWGNGCCDFISKTWFLYGAKVDITEHELFVAQNSAVRKKNLYLFELNLTRKNIFYFQ